MTNAEIFKDIFGLYATEVWSMPESEFLHWLNKENVYNNKKYQNTSLKTDRDGVSEKDMIYRRSAIRLTWEEPAYYDPLNVLTELREKIKALPSAEPKIVRCKDCKYNPKDSWFECPMSHLNERQRPEDAWCWRAKRRTDE